MILAKIIYYFIAKISLLLDNLWNVIELNRNNIKYNYTLKVLGRVIVKNTGEIIIGDNVSINNSSNYNPVGLPHPSILCTLKKEAVIKIGNNVGISGASIVAATSIKIGNRVLIGGGVGIWDTDFHPLNYKVRAIHQTKNATSKPIIIEDDVFIGARVIILKGVTIGKGAVIGAGSIISKNIPAGSTVISTNNVIKSIKK